MPTQGAPGTPGPATRGSPLEVGPTQGRAHGGGAKVGGNGIIRG